MDIKEIALTDEAAQKVFKNEHCNISADLAGILARALIESYKAELLKEVGEPVGYLHQWIEYHPYGDTFAGEPCSAITNDGKPFDKSDTVTPLYTLDQLAAAVLKATKPLEDRLAAAQEEIEASSKDSLRLLESVKYLRGIAEHGEERQQREDETVEQFVLGYVKKLEDQLAKAEQRVAEACALQVATEIKFHWLDAARVAKEIRSGEWKRYLK